MRPCAVPRAVGVPSGAVALAAGVAGTPDGACWVVPAAGCAKPAAALPGVADGAAAVF